MLNPYDHPAQLRTLSLSASSPTGLSGPSLGALDRYGAFTDLAALKAASTRPLRKSLRVNTLKSSTYRFTAWAQERGWQLRPVPWCPEGFFIEREDHSVALGKDLLHLLGHTYMQEAASMLPAALLDPQPGETILDMSAAPGSKTTQIAAAMKGKGVIVGNDVQEKRLWTLKSSLHRCGVTNYIVTKKVGQWFAKHMTERFDRVLCDAPCTAQGTSRKDSDALLYCGQENIGKMARLQRELLAAAVHACKVGGRIVYSTCTLTPEENEDVVISVLKKFAGQVEVVDGRVESARLPPVCRQGRTGQGKWKTESEALEHAVADSLLVQKKHFPLSTFHFPFLRLWPQIYDTEGFFCAVLKKVAPTKHPEKLLPVRFQEELLPPARQKDIGKICEEMYGASFLHEGDRLLLRSDQVLLSTQDVAEFRLPVQDYSLGLPFARRLDPGRIRLSQELITLRGHEASRNILEISESELNALLDGKDIPCLADLRGDPILLFRGMPAGSSLAKDGMLRNRLPRWLVAKS
ncbi:NOL1/NOP2/sun family putative RNA methylase [Candidatus Peregrinibacteria bacterium]|nr:NOL1/NOP2/sun family putative RNA methylase [Candidatus Peregrinibacteria bacterium]